MDDDPGRPAGARRLSRQAERRRACSKSRGLRAGYGRIPILHGRRPARSRTASSSASSATTAWASRRCCKTLMGFLPATGGAHRLRRRRHHPRAAARARAARPRLRAAGPRDLSRPVGARQPAHGRGERRRSTTTCIDAVLEDFPRLKPLLDRAGGLLSGGEQQFLALARCLCGEPKLHPARRADRGHPAVDHRGDRRDPARRCRPARADHHPGRAEPRFHRRLSERVLVIQKGRSPARSARRSTCTTTALVEEFVGMASAPAPTLFGRNRTGESTMASVKTADHRPS